ncbi:Choline O-acetyltransferase [Armadillidium nasatum]|uniref:Choline O-acetyltransferase n=1 Tax=Armadillidium nasatum TaxID=96803 RepID=A0A5N5STJ0_9CRUS|nr:Choline O-acetyltransferase [Armadillidium nasatum]
MGHRYLSRWMSWSGSTPTPPGTPVKSSPIEGAIAIPVSPQPPRIIQGRSRASSKASTTSISTSEKKQKINANLLWFQYPIVPKLPVPPLGHTLSWYLKHLKCVLKTEDFKEVEEIVQVFGKPEGIGEKIQEELIKRHDRMDNWWWMEDMYLNVPLSLPVNSNPGMVFPRQEFSSTKEMLAFAARLIAGSLDMKEKIDLNDLEVDRCSARERYQPLCMEQYGRVFTTYRKPAIPKDRQVSNANAPKANQHIIVFLKNHIFRLDAVSNGMRMSCNQIHSQLLEIYNFVEEYEEADPPPIGIMTADNRRTWAQNRQILIGEGIVVIQLVEQLLQNLQDDLMTEQKNDEGEKSNTETSKDDDEEGKSSYAPFPPPSHLEWRVTPVIMKRLQESAENVDRLVDDLDFRILRYIAYGRNFIKKGKVSPDAFIQMSLQLAFFRTHGRLTSTYESASTRRFRLGRVDCIRSNTPEVLTWCEAMVLNAPMADLIRKFDNALSAQTEIMINNILGNGIDIHLLGLREMAKEMEMETPKIFEHESYAESNHFRLSTSQVPTISDSWMGYGPVCPDGYGASYNPHPDYIVFCLSAFNSCEITSTLEFGRNLERALDDMKTLLTARAAN